mgnify:CR=1 FL=1
MREKSRRPRQMRKPARSSAPCGETGRILLFLGRKAPGAVAGTLDGRPGSGAYRPRRDQMRITPQLLAAVVNRAGTSEALR